MQLKLIFMAIKFKNSYKYRYVRQYGKEISFRYTNQIRRVFVYNGLIIFNTKKAKVTKIVTSVVCRTSAASALLRQLRNFYKTVIKIQKQYKLLHMIKASQKNLLMKRIKIEGNYLTQFWMEETAGKSNHGFKMARYLSKIVAQTGSMVKDEDEEAYLKDALKWQVCLTNQLGIKKKPKRDQQVNYDDICQYFIDMLFERHQLLAQINYLSIKVREMMIVIKLINDIQSTDFTKEKMTLLLNIQTALRKLRYAKK